MLLYTPSYSIVSTISREKCNLISSVPIACLFLQCPERNLQRPYSSLNLSLSSWLISLPLWDLKDVQITAQPAYLLPPAQPPELCWSHFSTWTTYASPTENHRSKALIYILAPNLTSSPDPFDMNSSAWTPELLLVMLLHPPTEKSTSFFPPLTLAAWFFPARPSLPCPTGTACFHLSGPRGNSESKLVELVGTAKPYAMSSMSQEFRM